MLSNKKIRLAIKTMAYVCIFVFWLWPVRNIPDECCDLNLRYYEICASHDGINPFHLFWNGESTAKYVGIRRYGKDGTPDRELKEGQHFVHAYPPWHTTFFWFYGWLSHSVVTYGMYFANIIMLAAMFFCLVRFCSKYGFSYLQELLIVVVMGVYFREAALKCIFTGNYGIMVAALSIVFLWAMDHDRQILAGVVWAFMMVKPQLAVPFFWPLLFSRRYRAIAVMVIILFVATLFPAIVYQESPIDLVLQIPKLGAHFINPESNYSGPELAGPLLKAVPKSLAQYAVLIVAAGGMLFCAAASYFARDCKSWWRRTVPATVIIPYWTYFNKWDGDTMMIWNVVLLVAVFLVGETIHKIQKMV